LQVYHRQRNRDGRSDDLTRLSLNVGKDRTQDLETPGDFLEALRERYYMERPMQICSFQQSVGMAAETKLFKEPEALLGIGKGQRSLPWYGLYRRRHQA
jgi:hypothetical protein